MSENTKIEWCDHTFNPWEGCQKVGPGCDHCYAEARNARFGGGTAPNWGPGATRRRTSAANWKLPVKWNRQFQLKQNSWDKFVASNPGMSDQQLLSTGFVKPKRPRVFCASLADVFDNEASPEWRTELFALIRATPSLDWLLLTKRVGNVAAMVEIAGGWPTNAQLGITICNQSEADRDIAKALATKEQFDIGVVFLSMEPLLGPVDIWRWLTPTGIHCQDVCPDTQYVKQEEVETWENGRGEINPHCPRCGECASWTGYDPGINWVIVGGESGPRARPAHPDWIRSLREQCDEAGVPFHFKQWGEWHTKAFQMSTGAAVFRQFDDYQQWVSKPQWINGGICLDRHGTELKCGGDMARARDSNSFPVTIMHKVGKKAAGRLLDGVQHHGFPESE